MKKRILCGAVLFGAAACFTLNGQFSGGGDFGSAGDPVYEQNLNQPSARTIYVGRYGYWRFQPVKMAYYSWMPGAKVPSEFRIHDASGRIVFTGQALRMRNPVGVLAPVGINFPGERIYALNFSAFNDPGKFYISMTGCSNSDFFTIGGDLPVDSYPEPDLLTFERQSGILLPEHLKPIVDDTFLHTPFQYPVFYPYPAQKTVLPPNDYETYE